MANKKKIQPRSGTKTAKKKLAKKSLKKAVKRKLSKQATSSSIALKKKVAKKSISKKVISKKKTALVKKQLSQKTRKSSKKDTSLKSNNSILNNEIEEDQLESASSGEISSTRKSSSNHSIENVKKNARLKSTIKKETSENIDSENKNDIIKAENDKALIKKQETLLQEDVEKKLPEQKTLPQEIDENPDKVMSIGGHLDELRTIIIRILKGLAILIVLAMFFSSPIHKYLSYPYRREIGLGQKAIFLLSNKLKKEISPIITKYYKSISPFTLKELSSLAVPDSEEKEFSLENLWDKVFGSIGPSSFSDVELFVFDLSTMKKEEARLSIKKLLHFFAPHQLLLIGDFQENGRDRYLINGLLRKQEIEFWFTQPIFKAKVKRAIEESFYRTHKRRTGAKFVQLRPGEMFSVYIKLAVLIALLIGFPWVLYQVWSFFAPAFSESLQRIGSIVIISSTALFWSGVFLAWFSVFPQTLYYLAVKFNFSNTETQFSLADYYDFFFGFHFGFGIAFQIPIILIVLGKIGIISSSLLLKNYRHVIIIMALVSAILTPPDILSQIMLLLPLSGLYFFSAAVIYLMERRRRSS